MTTIVITVDIPEHRFESDEQAILYRDKIGEATCALMNLIGTDKGVLAQIEYRD